jgi:hypothetical protein
MLQNWHENEAGINARFTNGRRTTTHWGFRRQTDSPSPSVSEPLTFMPHRIRRHHRLRLALRDIVLDTPSPASVLPGSGEVAEWSKALAC